MLPATRSRCHYGPRRSEDEPTRLRADSKAAGSAAVRPTRSPISAVMRWLLRTPTVLAAERRGFALSLARRTDRDGWCDACRCAVGAACFVAVEESVAQNEDRDRVEPAEDDVDH